MANIVSEGQRLGEILVQGQRGGHGSGDLCDFDCVGETVAEMIGEALAKDLGFALQAAECAGCEQCGHDPAGTPSDRDEAAPDSAGLAVPDLETAVPRESLASDGVRLRKQRHGHAGHRSFLGP